jgi:hypothetical protein
MRFTAFEFQSNLFANSSTSPKWRIEQVSILHAFYRSAFRVRRLCQFSHLSLKMGCPVGFDPTIS